MLRFTGHVSPCGGGYVWERQDGRAADVNDARLAKKLLLRPRDGVYENHYDPFVTEPALFRIFAALSPTPDSILAFATKYGDISPVDDTIQRGGMSLWDWRAEIEKFRQMVEAADRLLTPPASHRALLRQLADIAVFIEPLLLTVPVFLLGAIKNEAIELRGNVFGLMDVLNLQLVEAIVERKSYRTCDHCSKPFEVTPQVNRSDRIFCSDNCRVKAYQRRRKQAVELRRAGQTLREIAKTLGSDLPTVKRWVQDVDRKE